MKSIICEKPGKMIIKDEKLNNEIPKDHVLIKIKYIGICGTDIHAYGGKQPFFEYPRILGHELSGKIEKTGELVEGFQHGDKVTIIPYVSCGDCLPCVNDKPNCCENIEVIGVHRDGGMTEYLVVPYQNVIKINDLPLKMGAMIEPLSIGAHGVRRANVQQDETVLVVGAGPIGLGVARFSKLLGAKVIVADLSEQRLEFCQEWSECDETIISNENIIEDIKEMNEGKLPTVVFDATGNRNSMEQAFNYVNHGGRIVYVGLVKDNIQFVDSDFHAKEITLMASRNATLEDFDYVINQIRDGKIQESYFTNELEFKKTPDFFEKGVFKTNKTVIEI
ncbi:zinc-binding alcohol dehydrogenase family protein [Mammaliicoccus sp. H-M34]|uniref:zinc-binding alcohol dehydrogenase family protein n=1 Tax=Mammaliicoccus sp. H-M34 TaxID=2898693 RepID=UPI001EFAA64C|nr:zinc-binding alcohol dehydrogenase family protein [Mammaliicoccus sp. H-M34]